MNIRDYAPTEQTTLVALLRERVPRDVGRAVSNAKIRRLIFAGMVRVDGVPCRNPSRSVRAHNRVTVLFDEEKFFAEKQPDDTAFDLTARDILFEDEAIIVVNKPAFFPTEAGMVQSRDNLHAAVVRYLTEKTQARNPCYAGTVHRLDRETSGAILFAKSRPIAAACHALFESHAVHKQYRAVVFPAPASDAPFVVEMPMGRISPKSQAAKWGRVAEKDGGVYSRTDFLPLGTERRAGKTVAVMDCTLYTGRTHQIRVHLASVGTPILGDTRYGGAPFDRVMLHAHTLTFPHPVTGETITVSAPLPAGF